MYNCGQFLIFTHKTFRNKTIKKMPPVFSTYETIPKCFSFTSLDEARIVTPISSGSGVAIKKAPTMYAKYFWYLRGIFFKVKRDNLWFENSSISSANDILIKWNIIISPTKEPTPAIKPSRIIFLLLEKIRINAVAIGAVKENTYNMPEINMPK